MAFVDPSPFDTGEESVPVTTMGSRGAIAARAHTAQNFENTTLQKLDEWISGTYYSAEVFEEAPDLWEKCPIIYAQTHPNLNSFEKDPEAALKTVKTFEGDQGRIIGMVLKPRVEGGPDGGGGQKRFMCDARTDDDQANEHWEEGKLRVSTAMYVRETKDNHATKIMKANHVLFFVDDGVMQQGDKGAIIMNTEPRTVNDHNGDDMTKNKADAGRKGIVHAAIEKLRRAADDVIEAARSDKEFADEAKAFADAKDYVPRNPEGYGKAPEDAEWMKPTLDDFTEKQWAELSDDERRQISCCYAYVGDLTDFTSLKLPHHDPKTGDVVWNGVRSAFAVVMGARGGADLGTRNEEAISHLIAHYRDFDRQSPFGDMAMRFTGKVGDGETNMAEIDDLKSKVNSLEVEAKTHTDALKAKDSEITALKNTATENEKKMNTLQAERDTATTELKKYRDAEKEARFTAVLNTLPKGLYHKDEDKAALKKLFEEDPTRFIADMAPKMNTASATKGETGDEHDVKNTADMSQEDYMQKRKTVGDLIDAQRKAGGQ